MKEIQRRDREIQTHNYRVLIDCLIAATTLVKGYKVATSNVKHYPEKGLLFSI
mgnify:CR=1 FL=1